MDLALEMGTQSEEGERSAHGMDLALTAPPALPDPASPSTEFVAPTTYALGVQRASLLEQRPA
jgi:hypothetical protein